MDRIPKKQLIKPFRVLATGGGTAGHVYPGLEVLMNIRKPARVCWVGRKRSIEQRLVEDKGVVFYSIPAGKLRRYFSIRNVSDMFLMCIGLFKSFYIIYSFRPHVVFSKGSFVSVPVVIAARCMKVPVVSHESDFRPGLATKVNLLFTKILCTSWQGSEQFVRGKYRNRVVFTGNPVRSEIIRNKQAIVQGQIFVAGGSLGSSQINELLMNILKKLLVSYKVIHQHGEHYACRIIHENYKAFVFHDTYYQRMLAASELVVCRAGANTLNELACLGKAAILIPLQKHSRGEQVENARIYEQYGAAVVLSNPDAQTLLETIQYLMTHPAVRQDMSGRIKQSYKKDAARAIAAILWQQSSY